MITLITNSNPLQEIGIKSLKAYVEHFNIPARVIYLNKCSCLSASVIERVIEISRGSKLIGFSLMSKDWDICLPIIREINTRLKIPIILGGIHPTALPEESLQHADFVCVGEGEEPLRRLYESIINKKIDLNIPNIFQKQNGKIKRPSEYFFAESLDNLPFPDYRLKNSYLFIRGHNEIIKIPEEALKKRKFFGNSFLFYGQRGCNFSCTYCSNSLYHKLARDSKHKWHRLASPQRIKKELKTHLANLPFVNHIAINDDNFLVRNAEEIKNIASFINKDLGLTFTINATPPFVTEEKISLLVNYGLRGISFGVQSGSERILKKIYKRFVTNEQVIKAANIVSSFKDRGLKADYGFILDNPYEDNNDWRDSLKLWLSLPQPKTLSLYTLEFFPGTAIAERALKDGILPSLQKGYQI